MKLIADSGSTKTDWMFLDHSGMLCRMQTAGINPFFRSSDDIVTELRSALLPLGYQVDQVFFYGAGIVNSEKALVVEKALTQLYGKIHCSVSSDVLGAARASCGHRAGIACILGTGSNACFYDGQKIVENIPPMGYILGDEGSGAVMGRNLLGDYFKLVMPADLRPVFKERFNIEKDDVLNQVYRQEKPNKYLAQFAVFLSEQISHDYCREFVSANLAAFVNRNILNLAQCSSVPINFVGSVAYYFQDILKALLAKAGLEAGQIIKEPIDGLSAYHFE